MMLAMITMMMLAMITMMMLVMITMMMMVMVAQGVWSSAAAVTKGLLDKLHQEGAGMVRMALSGRDGKSPPARD